MAEHPFAPFVRILGKGKKGSRSLTREESYEAMRMILDEQVEPEQLGAFLMLLRVKEESPEELAGFVEAARISAQAPEISVDLDWSTYAGKKRQLPWFLLVAFLLAEQGVRVFMHGAKGHTPGRIYTEDILSLFGHSTCHNWIQVQASLDESNFAFMSINDLVPRLGQIISLRSILGLRSPVHTLCRILNPLEADFVIGGTFHTAYTPMHQKARHILGARHSLTIRGDSGEAEMKPDSDCDTRWIVNGELQDQTWDRIYSRRFLRNEDMNPEELLRVWRGEQESEYGVGAVKSTLAAVLLLMNKAENRESALVQASSIWENRDRNRF